jgi:hypothetical protein
VASSKKQTTMAKMARERAVREKRLLKQAKKEARKLASANPDGDAGDTPADGEAAPSIDVRSPRPV